MRTISEIGKIVRELRGELSLREFAEKCAMSHTTIDNIEKGVDFRTGKPVQVKISTLEKISLACNVPLNYIIGDDTSRLVKGTNRIKCLRAFREHTQEQFAHHLGVDVSEIALWEQDEQNTPREYAEKLSIEFKVPLDFIYGKNFIINQPISAWRADQREDMQNAMLDARDFFLCIYGRPTFIDDKPEYEALKSLSEEEKALIATFRRLSSEQQKTVILMIQALPTEK